MDAEALREGPHSAPVPGNRPFVAWVPARAVPREPRTLPAPAAGGPGRLSGARAARCLPGVWRAFSTQDFASPHTEAQGHSAPGHVSRGSLVRGHAPSAAPSAAQARTTARMARRPLTLRSLGDQ